MKKILAIVAAFAVVGFNGFMLMEGAVSQAQVTEQWYVTLDVTSELAFECDHDASSLALASIAGMTGGSSSATTSCNVETSNVDGWSLSIGDTDGTNGIMSNGGSETIAAYSPATPGTPETWSLSSPSSSEYGFYAAGTYVSSGYGADLYRDLPNMAAAVIVATNNTETAVGGVDTVFGFKVEVGTTKNQASGSYTSDVTATATEL